MRKIFKIVVLISLSGVALFFALLAFTTEQPPLQEIRDAREKITEAKRIEAHLFSPVRYNEALTKYDSAMFCWNYENQRFIIFRDYEKVEELAIEARNLALTAIGNATTNSYRLKKDLKNKLDSLSDGMEDYQRYFSRLPLSTEVKKQVQKGMLLFKEAKIAFEKYDLTTAGKKLDIAGDMIEGTNSSAQDLLGVYFQRYSDWKRWTDKTIDHSRKNKSYSIVIDKYSHECRLYSNGKLKHKFAAEFGNNWMTNKTRQGDKSTPEGNYRVIDKFANGHTVYYKALLLDYPNEDDKLRFTVNKKNGTIPPDADIGSLIEIHGHGGKGADWTNGCIALRDSDIDILYSCCPVGTRVTIVGSLQSLDELLKE